MRRPPSTPAPMRRALPLLLALAVGACASRGGPALSSRIPAVTGETVVPYAMRHIEVVPGTGLPMRPRACVYAHYTGWLVDGTKFDSSRDTMPNGAPREPIAFPQGQRRVIAGWDAGFEGMRVGGQRRLIIPYQVAYGELGRPPVIPPRATLVFDVELVGVADTLPRAADVPPGSPPACPAWRTVRDTPR